uniref:Uncharacterized protein n=1 Tax=Rhizophora mucronata TaxID=61149 RepID=A0A2P2Q5R9_RHIMU
MLVRQRMNILHNTSKHQYITKFNNYLLLTIYNIIVVSIIIIIIMSLTVIRWRLNHR